MPSKTFNFQRLARMGGGEDAIDQIKTDLPIPYVLAQHNIEVRQAGTVLKARCPWHDDEDPSLDIKKDQNGYDRAFCSPCGWHGDVLDILQRLNACDLKQAIKHGFDYLDGGVQMEGILAAANQPEVPVEVLEEAYRNFRAQHDDAGLHAFLHKKGIGYIDAEWLTREYGVVAVGETIYFPVADAGRSVLGYKYRNGTDQTLTARGSRLREWYGVWRDRDPDKPVVICEGESDTWVAAWHLSSLGYATLGLPSGAGSNPPVENLKGRVVVLALDGDPAGRQAALRWAHRLQGVAEEVRVAAVPDGRDLADLADPSDIIIGARPVAPAATGIDTSDAAFLAPGKEEMRVLSNWRIDPERVLEGDGEVAYEGVLHPSRERVVIRASDMKSDSSLITWATQFGLSWLGTKRDAQNLAMWFNNQRPFLSQGRAATQVGLAEGNVFVTPAGYIGEHRVTYIPKLDVPFEYTLEPNEDWREALETALDLHRIEVVTPILAWLSVAPLRMKFRDFPFLNVAGLSGTGKSTLIETLLEKGAGVYGHEALTATTEFAINARIDGSNGFPVWFDEFRNHAKSSALRGLSQALRAAYTREGSSKGFVSKTSGLGLNQYRADAPIIVSGEEYLKERSHFDRAISIVLPPEGRNPLALQALRGQPGWAFEYLHWLADRLAHNELPAPPVEGRGPLDLPSRMRTNIAVIEYGWNLLADFADLPVEALDLSLVLGSMTEAEDNDPTMEALRWAVGQPDPYDGSVVVQQIDDTVYVNIPNFINAVEKGTKFELPGGEHHVRDFCKTNFEAEATKIGPADKRVRVWAFPASHLLE